MTTIATAAARRLSALRALGDRLPVPSLACKQKSPPDWRAFESPDIWSGELSVRGTNDPRLLTRSRDRDALRAASTVIGDRQTGVQRAGHLRRESHVNCAGLQWWQRRAAIE